MIEPEDKVAAVVDAAGGRLVSRVRLQKTVYLLDQLGLSSGFDYEYHHYGPYSRDLDNATSDADALGVVQEKIQHRAGDGASYSVFILPKSGSSKDEALGTLGRSKAAELVQKFASTELTVLELAATVDWLWRYERCRDWQSEIARRKPMKVGNGRLDRAVKLLRDLGLTPPVPERGAIMAPEG
jgi:uncharacterized protein YwgA